VLSGIAGDEVTGGVPTPLPELADLLARARVKKLATRLKLWALDKRKPWTYLLVETTRKFLPTTLFGSPRYTTPPAWLNPTFVARNRWALQGYENRLKFLGPLPSFQENCSTLEALRRQLESVPLPSSPSFERRYPYLDRRLLEFLYAIPREQLIRPGQRRSLLRRSLAGIVPEEILQRKRKAFAGRSMTTSISRQWPSLEMFTKHMISSELGIVNANHFSTSLEQVRHGREAALVPLMRTIGLELWLRNRKHMNCEAFSLS
jgi:asparagine synthase (glutamine-hydrolysing)